MPAAMSASQYGSKALLLNSQVWLSYTPTVEGSQMVQGKPAAIACSSYMAAHAPAACCANAPCAATLRGSSKMHQRHCKLCHTVLRCFCLQPPWAYRVPHHYTVCTVGTDQAAVVLAASPSQLDTATATLPLLLGPLCTITSFHTCFGGKAQLCNDSVRLCNYACINLCTNKSAQAVMDPCIPELQCASNSRSEQLAYIVPLQ